MRDRIKNGANMLDDHVFQFDFLNDDFSKLPQGLQNIINDTEKRKKLVIYINPPYAEAATNATSAKDRINKRGVSFTATQKKYSLKIGIATKELFAQFFTRIKGEIPTAILAQFSKLKIVQGPNFSKFRDFFTVDFLNGFVVPADTFDNVSGQFPIGFMIWNLDSKNKIQKIECDIINKNAENIGNKTFYAYDDNVFITDWYRNYHTRIESAQNIGAIGLYGSDFQHNNFIRVTNIKEHPNRWTYITKDNLIETCIYLSVRKVILATWLNDRDQFLYPNDGWKTDAEFQNDCLAYTLFNNNIQSKYGVNNWIPFTEKEVNARDKFESNFMTNFINNKKSEVVIRNTGGGSGGGGYSMQMQMFKVEEPQVEYQNKPRAFSMDAKNVFDAGRALWKYYHAQANCNVNASLYDIREYFQGRNDNSKMNNTSEDEKYTELIGNLRDKLKILAKKIESKVYEYEFLKK
ncbi:MAG: hypothetical protein LBV75_05510, partial [Paludibacter sp.]|jgi:hypothetical protein|nr:hypothetical protein [Paludibacter sp.]